MGYNYCKDHRSGITYVYDVSSQIDETGKKKTVRKLIGKLDENGDVVGTSGRRGRLPKTREKMAGENDTGTQEIIDALQKQISELKETNRILQKEKDILVNGMKHLLDQTM